MKIWITFRTAWIDDYTDSGCSTVNIFGVYFSKEKAEESVKEYASCVIEWHEGNMPTQEEFEKVEEAYWNAKYSEDNL